VRSDSALIGRTHTVMIMRREAAVIVAPKVGKVQKIADLQNATIGVTREGPIDGSLLAPVLDYYGITRDKARSCRGAGDGIADAFRQKKIDAMIAVGPVTAKQMGEAVADAAARIKGHAASSSRSRRPMRSSSTSRRWNRSRSSRGRSRGRPPRPPESFNTLGYSIRLVTNTKTDSDSIAELARQLFLIRQNLSVAVPGAGLMETPDVDEATAFLVHPGVRAYVNGEQRSWFDKYNDYIYLGLFLGSGVGSVAAAMFGWMRGGGSQARRPLPRQRIELVFDAVRDARTPEQLDAAEREADEVVRSVFAPGGRWEAVPATPLRASISRWPNLRGRNRGTARRAQDRLIFACIVRNDFCGARDPRDRHDRSADPPHGAHYQRIRRRLLQPRSGARASPARSHTRMPQRRCRDVAPDRRPVLQAVLARARRPDRARHGGGNRSSSLGFVLTRGCKPCRGALLDLWHADARGTTTIPASAWLASQFGRRGRAASASAPSCGQLSGAHAPLPRQGDSRRAAGCSPRNSISRASRATEGMSCSVEELLIRTAKEQGSARRRFDFVLDVR
jgi:hypothetical protein